MQQKKIDFEGVLQYGQTVTLEFLNLSNNFFNIFFGVFGVRSPDSESFSSIGPFLGVLAFLVPTLVMRVSGFN